MKRLLIVLIVCLWSSQAGAESFRHQERRLPPSESCSLEEFASAEKAKEYIAANGGELFRDQDTYTYRVVRCNFDIGERVIIVYNLKDD